MSGFGKPSKFSLTAPSVEIYPQTSAPMTALRWIAIYRFDLFWLCGGFFRRSRPSQPVKPLKRKGISAPQHLSPRLSIGRGLFYVCATCATRSIVGERFLFDALRGCRCVLLIYLGDMI